MLSAGTVRALLDAVRESTEGVRPTPALRAAIDDAERYLASLGGPSRYTLRQGGRLGWVIGAGDGIDIAAAEGTEIGRGLAWVEVAVAWPGDPVALSAFLPPGADVADPSKRAMVMRSRVVRWLADNADVALAELLGEALDLSLDPVQGVVLRYAPPRYAPPIVTQWS